MTDISPGVTDWRRLSPWSMVHFAARSIVENVRAAILGGSGGTYGLTQSGLAEYVWAVPIVLLAFVLFRAVVSYLTCFYRLHADVVEVRRGLLFKQLTNLPFARVQNISIEHPFYFRPLGLVTLKIDGAGSAGEEVHLAALRLEEAESLRTYIAAKRGQLGAAAVERQTGTVKDGAGTILLTRSLRDLVVHGLTNNRSHLIIAGIFSVVAQGDVPVGAAVRALGVDVDPWVTGMGVLLAVLLFAIAFTLLGGAVALLSVLAAVFVYYRFTIRKAPADSLAIERGLLTRHEILVRKSRIQTVIASQDWLERLTGRRNVILEQISHTVQAGGDWSRVREKILIPSVSRADTAALAIEIEELRGFEDLPFTPISRRYFRKHAAIASAIYLLVLAAMLMTPLPPAVFLPLAAAIWPLHMVVIHLRWKRGGLAIHEGMVVARSGTIGIDYHVFPAFKLQQVSHVQSVLMRRHDVSNVVFRTASTSVKVPYLSTPFARSVVNYCAFAVESSGKSWM